MVSADAMFTHADVCRTVLEQGGDYILYAKENQATLHRDIATTFTTAECGSFPLSLQASWDRDVRTASVPSKGHGRLERRTIATTTWLNDYLSGWPEVKQVFRLERQRQEKGQTTAEVVYGITSLSRLAADALRHLSYTRSHWGIENGLRYTRDETLGEDRCRVRRGPAPRVLASLRNVAVYLLRGLDYPSVAAATRAMAACPNLALDMLHDPPSISA